MIETLYIGFVAILAYYVGYWRGVYVTKEQMIKAFQMLSEAGIALIPDGKHKLVATPDWLQTKDDGSIEIDFEDEQT